MRRILLAVAAALAVTSGASGRSVAAEWATRESLGNMPPRLRAAWLQRRGQDASYWTNFRDPLDQGLRLVGKYGRGPSVEVTGQGTLMALTLGSECALLDVSNPSQPQVLSELQLDFIPRNSLLCDSLLVTAGNGVQLWSIADPAQPNLLGEIPGAVGDVAVWDTLLYFISRDTFFAYSIGNPTAPRRLGQYRDSGYVATTTAGTAVVVRPNDQLGFVDVSVPASPQPVGSYPGWCLSATARQNICCISLGNPNQPAWLRFTILDISDPSSPAPLGSVDSCGGYDIFLSDSIAYLSGYYTGGHEFSSVNIADSTHPLALGQCGTNGQNFGVWADPERGFAYVADGWSGLGVIDIVNPDVPALDSGMFKADQALDVWLDSDRAFVADYRAGLKVVDVANPAAPTEIGCMDTTIGTATTTCAARDSFAYMGWANPPPFLRTVDVTNPARPLMAGGSTIFDWPEDMTLRDTLLYCAMPNRFQVINVARPRAPVLVGSCAGDGVAIALQDSFAYTAAGAIRITNVARPDSPIVVATITGHGASGIAVRDTFLYFPYAYDTLFVYSVANPAQPRLLAAVQIGVWPMDVVLGDRRAYVALSDGNGVEVFDLTDPGQPVSRGRTSAPYDVRRLAYRDGLLYAAMYEAGVAVYETTSTAIIETSGRELRVRGQVAVRPNPTRGAVTLRLASSGKVDIVVRDVAGRMVQRWLAEPDGRGEVRLDLTNQSRGVYFVEVGTGRRNQRVSVVRN